MWNSIEPRQSGDAYFISFTDEAYLREVQRRQRRAQNDRPNRRASYLFQVGRQPITLELVELRIIRFLSSRPYHAFSREDIAAAVSSEAHPVEAEGLDAHVASLRRKLGMFHDYIQSVPFIGYRFKA